MPPETENDINLGGARNMKMNKLKKRDNNAKCPICGEQVIVGSSANWCPTFHYECEHLRINGKDLLVAEKFAGDGFTVCVGYANTFHAPRGVSLIRRTGPTTVEWRSLTEDADTDETEVTHG